MTVRHLPSQLPLDWYLNALCNTTDADGHSEIEGWLSTASNALTFETMASFARSDFLLRVEIDREDLSVSIGDGWLRDDELLAELLETVDAGI
jgi:hypothetical protein